MARFAVFVALFALAGCAPCTTSVGTSVSASINTTDGSVASGAALTFSVDGGSAQSCDDASDGTWSCGYDQLGTIAVTATAPGYSTQTQSTTVSADHCGHASERHLSFLLSPLSAS